MRLPTRDISAQDRAVETILKGRNSYPSFFVEPQPDETTVVMALGLDGSPLKRWTVFRNGITTEDEVQPCST